MHTVYPRLLFDNLQTVGGGNPYLANAHKLTDHRNENAPFTLRQYQAWANFSRKATMTMILRCTQSSFQARSAVAVVQMLAALHDATADALPAKDVALRIAADFVPSTNEQCSIVRYADTVLVTSYIFLS